MSFPRLMYVRDCSTPSLPRSTTVTSRAVTDPVANASYLVGRERMVLEGLASVHEMFVHHEDVRRAQPGWASRELDDKTTVAVKRRVPIVSRAGLSKSMTALPARLTLRTPDGQTLAAVGNGSPVTVTGEPGELLLFAFGRNAVRVDFGGDDDVVAAVRAAKRGF